VTVVPFSHSDAVVTIGPESPVWQGPEHLWEYHRDAEKAFVRIRPPATVSDAVLAQIAAEVRKVAIAVRVDPRPRPDVVPEGSHQGPEGAVMPTALSARAIVLQLVEESYSSDRDALRTLCEEAMAAASM